jgi:hypothetical protein
MRGCFVHRRCQSFGFLVNKMPRYVADDVLLLREKISRNGGRQIADVGNVRRRDQGPRSASSSSSSCTADAVDEHSSAGREIVIDDVVHDWYIETPRRHIGNDEKITLSLAELSKLALASQLVQGSVYVRCCVS